MKILVISLAGIGDTLIATPLIHELRANFPSARLDAFVLWPGSRDLLLENPHLDNIYQKNLMKTGVMENLSFLRRLRRNRYDVSINTHPQSRIHYRAIARAIGATIRVSHSYDNASPVDSVLVNRVIPQDYSIHGVENNLRLLGLVGIKPTQTAHKLEVTLNNEELTWAEAFLREHQLIDRQRLGIHVGSGGTKNLPLKRWPLPQYIALLNQLKATHPQLAILLFGGPEEREAHAQIQRDVSNNAIFVPESRTLRQAAALLKKCHAFLSVDTALMHLAAAMQVPNQIVIEAPTLNITNLPYQNPHTLVSNPVVAGRNLDYYRYDGGPIRGTREELIDCMNSVTVAEVHKVLQEVLAS